MNSWRCWDHCTWNGHRSFTPSLYNIPKYLFYLALLDFHILYLSRSNVFEESCPDGSKRILKNSPPLTKTPKSWVIAEQTGTYHKWHLSTKTWPHPAAYSLHCWDTPDWTTHWVEDTADKLSKDFTSPHPPLDLLLDIVLAHQRSKSYFDPPVIRHLLLPPGNLQEPLDQTHLPGGRHQRQGSYSLTVLTPLTSSPWVMRWESTAGTHRTSSTEDHSSKVENPH